MPSEQPFSSQPNAGDEPVGPLRAAEDAISSTGSPAIQQMTISELPSGTATLVFTDIEGSTRLLEALGERYGEVLAEHRKRLREVFSASGGVEVDTQGDALFFAFSRAKDAAVAAVEAQRPLPHTPGPKASRSPCAWASTPTSRPWVTKATWEQMCIGRAHLRGGPHGGSGQARGCPPSSMRPGFPQMSLLR